MRRLDSPSIASLVAGDLPFALLDEPSRTRADAAAAATVAAEHVAAARAILADADHRTREQGRRVTVHAVPDWSASFRLDGSDDGLLVLSIVPSEGTRSTVLKVAAAWEDPTTSSSSLLLDLFDAALRAVLDPAPGDAAMETARALAAGALDRPDAVRSVLRASTPWDPGALRAENARGDGIGTRGPSGVAGLAVSCADAFTGPVVSIEPLIVVMTPGLLDPMERIRLAAVAAATGRPPA